MNRIPWNKKGFYKKCDRSVCENLKWISPSRLKTGRGKYCSRRCAKLGRPGHWTGRNRPDVWNKGKGVLTSKEQSIRHSLEYRTWRQLVWERDAFTCQMCGQKGKDLNANHIKVFSRYPELRLIVANGITLCKFCHRIVTRHEEEWESYFNFNLVTRGFLVDNKWEAVWA